MDKEMLIISDKTISTRKFFEAYPLTTRDKSKIKRDLGYSRSAIDAWSSGRHRIQRPVLEYIIQECTMNKYGEWTAASSEARAALLDAGSLVLNKKAKYFLASRNWHDADICNGKTNSMKQKIVSPHIEDLIPLLDEKFFELFLSFEFFRKALTFKMNSFSCEDRLELVSILANTELV